MIILGPKKKNMITTIMRKMKGGAEYEDMKSENEENMDKMEREKLENKSDAQAIASKILDAVESKDSEKLAMCIEQIMSKKS